MKAFQSLAMRLPSIRFCRLAILMVAAAVVGFYVGSRWKEPDQFFSNLDECDERSNDIDFLRESARQLEEAVVLLKTSAGVGSDGVGQSGGAGGDATRALQAVERVIARLDPRHALSANDQSLRSAASADACGEVYMGSKYGSPYFREGFVPTEDCRRAAKRPLEELLTALLLAPPHKPAPGPPPDAPLSAIRTQHPRLLALAAVHPGRAPPAHPLTTAVAAPERRWATPGALLNRLVAGVRTPYVLVARDAVRVDELARPERLIYVISALGGNASVNARRTNDSGAWGVAVAGGAVRDPLGRWSTGCAETQLRNYALRVRRGYRYSALDCMLCDSLRGPFVARTSLLREVAFDERLPAPMVFEDWFLRVKRRGALAAVCPDALFFVGGDAEGGGGGGPEGREGREGWRLLAAVWQVDTVHLPGRPPLRFTCPEVHLPCDLRRLHKKGLLIPNCCLKEVADALAAYEDFASRHNLEYELNEGTALGAAKLQSVLPWDIDGDILILFDDFEKHKAKKEEMAELGYSFESFTEKNGFKYFSFLTPNVSIDMWCRKKLSTFLLPKEMQNYPTRMKILGIWMRGPWNPGLLVRNRYGPGYLKHAQHWTKLGMKNHNELYSVGSWSNCSLPNHHGCLNRYPAEGSFNVLPEDCPVSP